MSIFNKQILKILNEIEELSINEKKSFDEVKNGIQEQEIRNETTDEQEERLIRYKNMFEDQIMWDSKKIYFEITNNFLNNQINLPTFVTQIQDLRYQNLDQAREAEENLKFKTDFNFTSKSIGFAKVIDNLDSFAYHLDNSKSINQDSLRAEIKDSILPEFSKYSN